MQQKYRVKNYTTGNSMICREYQDMLIETLSSKRRQQLSYSNDKTRRVEETWNEEMIHAIFGYS